MFTFEQWKTDVEQVTTTLIGQPPENLNDVPYWDLCNKNISPSKLGTYVSCLHRSTDDTTYNIQHLTHLMNLIPDNILMQTLNNIHDVIQEISDNRDPV